MFRKIVKGIDRCFIHSAHGGKTGNKIILLYVELRVDYFPSTTIHRKRIQVEILPSSVTQ